MGHSKPGPGLLYAPPMNGRGPVDQNGQVVQVLHVVLAASCACRGLQEPCLLGPGARGVDHLALGPLGLGSLLSPPLLLGRLLLTLQPALVLHHGLQAAVRATAMNIWPDCEKLVAICTAAGSCALSQSAKHLQ